MFGPLPNPLQRRGGSYTLADKILFSYYITSSFKIRYPSSAPLSFGEGLGERTTD